MKHTLLLSALLLVGSAGDSAPAPIYKDKPSLESAHDALPKTLRERIELANGSRPELIQRMIHNLQFARTQKEKDIHLAGIEQGKGDYYHYPIDYLEYQRQQPEYLGREDRAKIDLALKFYRLRLEEGKKKGLVKDKPKDKRAGK